MRTIVVEEWVHIPEGGKRSLRGYQNFAYSYFDREDKKSEGSGT